MLSRDFPSIRCNTSMAPTCVQAFLPCIEGVIKKHLETVGKTISNSIAPLPRLGVTPLYDCFPFHSKVRLQE